VREYCPRLIEVALPIREISAEAVRQKSPQRGHISTLHLWWARRPLAAMRAVVFASLVPDPDDPRCPTAFREAVERCLKTDVPAQLRQYWRGRQSYRDVDPYRPYDGIEDTLRDRLLAFIAKWSPEALAYETGKSDKRPKPDQLLDDRSLVKWETSNPENPHGREVLRIARELVFAANGGRSPRVLDPFAGGGAIPLEVGRLGAQPIANDYNPVAYLILRATCEFPQRYGHPGRRRVAPERSGQVTAHEADVPNVLAHDVEHWARSILERARDKIGHLYPRGADGRPIVAYLWARTAPCSNPACRGEIPLLKSLFVCNKDDKRVALVMKVNRPAKTADFDIVRGKSISGAAGTMLTKGDVRCPFCEQITLVTDLRASGCTGKMGERMVAVVVEASSGKDYRRVEDSDLKAFCEAERADIERPQELIRPEVTASEERVANRGDITVHLYGMKTWGSLFNARQLVAMHTFVTCLRDALDAMAHEVADDEYRRAVATYLGLWISRNAMRMSSVGRWHISEEKIETPFDGARLPMKWDYPETNPFSEVSGGFANQLDLILRVLRREAAVPVPARVSIGDGAHLSLSAGECDVVVTDPPYFDEVAYADLSDFFYVWLKRAIGAVLPEVFLTPLTPKKEEATALKHRHHGDAAVADRHFTTKLADIFTEARRACREDGIISVVFAHQETHAWTALVNSLFAAGLTIDATWPVDMELKNRMRGLNSAALETSITVVCRPRVTGSAAAFRDVRREIEQVVADSVKRFWSYGFRGADLVVACYGPAVGVFGRYERVERADGTVVGVPELLDLARRAALDAIAGEFHGDPVSTLYYVWANLYGTAEQPWDDARLVVQMGGTAESAMEVARQQGIFVVDGATCRLALLADRDGRRDLGVNSDAPLIDMLHRAMKLWKAEDRASLVRYLAEHDLFEDTRFWKLAQALFEVMPRDSEDWKLVAALLAERETLRAEARTAGSRTVQPTLFETRG
jgi:putative DNA methylase